jgi:hypothetical protein
MIKIDLQVKCLPGYKCNVLNYRCRPAQWEHGVVKGVKARISKDGTYSVAYEVRLNRVTTGKSRMYPDGGCPIFVTVSDDSIISYEKEV